MYDIPELKERLIIIKQSSIDDAMILDENYLHLIKETPRSDEREQFIILHTFVQQRINSLKDIDE
jgi:hypothetical protein